MESDESSTEIRQIKRDTPPAHYILKIKCFTQLLDILQKTGINKYESDEFEAGDYKWKLVVYPNGNEKEDGKGYLSMYIASTDKKAISSGCHVNALLNFFVYDHINDKYLTIQDGKSKHFHVLKTEHGFSQLISLEEFTSSSNGYLVNDCCAFGAEVHVIKNTVKVNEFSVITDPPNGTFTWKIDNFSSLQKKSYNSDSFLVGGYRWKLQLYPKGDLDERDRSLSLYLYLESDDEGATKGQGVYAEWKMSIKQPILGNHAQRTFSHWFKSPGTGWGFGSFVLLSDLVDASKGFLVNDTLVVEAKITIISSFQDLSRR